MHLYSSRFSCAGWAHPVLGAPGAPGGILTWVIRFCAPKYPQEPPHAPKRRFEKICLAAVPPPPPPMTSPPAMPHPCLSPHLTFPIIKHPLKCQWQLRAILHPSMAQQQLLRGRRGGGGGAARPPATSHTGMLRPAPTCMLPTNTASQAVIYINTEPQTRWHQHSSSHQLWAACGAARVAAAS